MSLEAPSPDAAPPARPPPGWKVYGALLGILLLCGVCCVVVTAGYMYFLDVRSAR